MDQSELENKTDGKADLSSKENKKKSSKSKLGDSETDDDSSDEERKQQSKTNAQNETSDAESDSDHEGHLSTVESDDEEEKEKKKQAALKKELFASLPSHCSAYIPEDINPRPRKPPSPPKETTPEECFVACPKIISRKEWGAYPPTRPAEQMMYRVRPAIFLETDVSNCETFEDCSQVLRTMQRLQLDLLKFSDLPYSFLISEDGTIYEGRGWGYSNEKAQGFAGIGYIGFHSLEPLEGPSDVMLQATYNLIMCGVRKGFLYNPFASGAFSGETPIDLVKELMEHEEDIDYRTKPEDVGIDF